MEQKEIERLKALRVLNSHFRHESKFEHLTDRQVKCVLDAMQEFRKLDVMRSVCRSCGGELITLKTYGYDECMECGKTFRQTNAQRTRITAVFSLTFEAINLNHKTMNEEKKIDNAEPANENTACNLVLAEVKVGEEESIQCPYCDGQGWIAEHTNHKPEEPCDGCPIQLPCEYCYTEGRVTTKLMKEHIEANENYKIDEDDLPF